MSEVIEYLQSKNIPFEISGNDAKIYCPYCNHTALSIQIHTGVFRCWHCYNTNLINSPFIKGNLHKLKELMGDVIPVVPIVNQTTIKDDEDFTDLVEKYHLNILDDPKALKYLMKRGIDEDSIVKFKLGLAFKNNQNWISIPSYEDGIPKLIKYRKLPPYSDNCNIKDKYIREKGGKSVLFNGDVIKEYDEILLTEGELDCITLIQNGFPNAVGMTVGAGTLDTYWYDQLSDKNKIYLCLDSDSVGQTAAKDTWASRLGFERCYNVLLPEDYDINDFFLEFKKEDFEELLKTSTKFSISGVSSVRDVLLKMYRKSQSEDSQEEVYKLPWDCINNKIGGGLKPTHLTVIGAAAGLGKTTLALNIARHIGIEYNVPSFTLCLEMSDSNLVTKVIQDHFNLTSQEVIYDDALIYLSELEKIPMYFGYTPRITPDLYYNTVKAVHSRYGCRLFIFDNLQLMVRSDEESDYAKASQMFKQIAMEFNSMMVLISQPRKMIIGKLPTYEDMKGTSSISQDSDEIILLYREREKGEDGNSSFSPETKVIVDKARFASGGTTILINDGARSKFILPEKEIKKR